ncbi:adenylyl-sulfate kinase [Paraburkholderia sp. CNPSo 3272]|uniref:adenylyl-sulfate kinase n=1 Tax=Paraburkholderia sp. CNPSo 3272 TaxID=2940931 RepID=UPI0020B8FAE2|nr:adenylyl-sulfate kinase [Paraburkholderia sp. CNPSo 3272]MCP3728259.1 adenylyl-sulfate kinase [Paraburkholderia sp. CNPSo 3272]
MRRSLALAGEESRRIQVSRTTRLRLFQADSALEAPRRATATVEAFNTNAERMLQFITVPLRQLKGRYNLAHMHHRTGGGSVDISAPNGVVVWLTGMSGAGKSTIANAFVARMQTFGLRSTMLDGDVLRTGLNSDLGFSDEDRTENLRRVAHVAALFCNEGFLVVTATISPNPEHRENARRIIGADNFVEVFVDTPFDVCEARDPKGLYKLARRGQIKGFTGIASPYCPPTNPDVILRTEDIDVDSCVARIAEYLRQSRSDTLELRPVQNATLREEETFLKTGTHGR